MKINKKIYLFILLLLLITCITPEKKYYSAFTMIPGTERKMKTPGFWISLHTNPDKLIMNRSQIKNFNNTVNSVKNVVLYENIYEGDKLKNQIIKIYDYISKQKLYFYNGKKPFKSYYDSVLSNINVESINNEINVKFGIIIKYTNQRALPSYDLLNDIRGEYFFDSLQMSALDIGTPLAVLHKSKDNNWYFVHGPISDGWVEAGSFAFSSKKIISYYINKNPFTVITDPKADIYMDKGLLKHIDYARMGVRFPLNRIIDKNTAEILIPYRNDKGYLIIKKGYILKNSINIGYLNYTPRNIIIQAFKLLNTPYGWGGMFGEQDCSKFLNEIFATAGIILPRNSSAQAHAGEIIGEFNKDTENEEKIQIIKEKCIPGVSLFKLDGHIMLYLGEYNNNFYAVHSIWAYREKKGPADTIRLINRTAVTDMSLGDKTKKGSFLDRLIIINNVN